MSSAAASPTRDAVAGSRVRFHRRSEIMIRFRNRRRSAEKQADRCLIRNQACD
ncbi:hypothetical protein NOJ28_22295 [Neorhizobium galegae]|uniref:hypothetical protein n=1 Tax=Neorhizobium galegae TaxID=399 RepID=UPI0021078481|nr:hypothetical protein [Neorhizobium galegae]MCQ1768270.1 hypothetical protein [Neorhizobium galegae]MCQ1847242.1 hypothetical protein [Neorhizobium galegae]